MDSLSQVLLQLLSMCNSLQRHCDSNDVDVIRMAYDV